MATAILPKSGNLKVTSTKTTTKTQRGMKLRFKVNQAECFRRGINCDKSIVTVDVDPAKLDQEQRNLVADRLVGIDVVELWNSDKGTEKFYEYVEGVDKNTNCVVDVPKPVLIEADEPTFEALMQAIRRNQKEVDSRQARHRASALSLAEAGFDATKAMGQEVSVRLTEHSQEPRVVKVKMTKA